MESATQKCKTVEEQKEFWSKGRFFVYLYKFGEENYRSKERLPDSVQILQYFIVHDFYNREEVVIQLRERNYFPNLLTNFSM